jgi:hypothetical protein
MRITETINRKEKRHPSTTMLDLMTMKDVTKRAFKSGRRK